MDQITVGKDIIDAGKSIHHALDEYFQTCVKDPLKPIAGRILGYLYAHRGASSSDIQKHFALSKASVSENLSILIDRGDIVYEKSDIDGREKTISLTDQGIERAKQFRQIIVDFEKKLSKGLSESEMKELERLLSVVAENIGGLEHGE